MSGLEIVGVVLGTIPLAISALEHYQGIVGKYARWRTCKTVFSDLALELETEHVLLKNTCELLLSNAVRSSEVEDMIADPFGPMWQKASVKDHLRQRLHDSAPIFEENIKRMQSHLEALKSELPSDAFEKESSNGGMSTILREMGRIVVAIKQPQYEEHIRRLQESNKRVAELLDSSTKLAVPRRVRSQAKLFGLLRAVARNIHNALRSSFSCSCSPFHGVKFQLPTLNMIPQRDHDTTIRTKDFTFALTYDINALVSITGKGKGREGQWIWDEIVLRMAEGPAPFMYSFQSTPSATSPAQKPRTPRSFKKVLFADRPLLSSAPQLATSSSSTTTLTPTTSSTPPSVSVLADSHHNLATAVQPPELTDLCQALARRPSPGANRCCGYITDPSATSYHKFAVYFGSDEQKGPWSSVTLSDVLNDESFKCKRTGPSLAHQLSLAATVASSVLQLHETPWMPKNLTSRDIYFFKRDGRPDFNRVYLAKKLLDSGPTTCGESDCLEAARAIKNSTIFSLGILLIELILCEPISKLCPDDSQTSLRRAPAHPLLVKSTMTEILDEVEDVATGWYTDAVKSCLRCNFACRSMTLDDEDFRDEVYSHIVAPLQDSVDYSRGKL
ncbi:hypothetical protein F4780DRAFT_766699 [Xylariomycetidae sp. FL0641]|nr:hypothetical protein F4780DRAFT_766699 [Xylariomycetidae sp. FL0641]